MKKRLLVGAAVALALGAAPALAQEAPATETAIAADAAASPTVTTPLTATAPAPDAAANVALPPPAPSRARPAVDTDEGGLWGLSDRAEQQARQSGELERDPALNAYIRGIACQTAGPYCGDIRLYVMNRPFFNASMAPNGYMEVWSGLLLRAEDEAQLAFVLGHETGHYAENHSIETLRTVRSRATTAMILSIGLGVVGAGIVGDLIYLGTIASVFGFSRENELEADGIGYTHAVAVGYDPHAGEKLWNNLIEEGRVSDNPDVRRREARASVFATHPLSSDRVEALAERAANAPEGQTHRERYRAAIRPFLDPWLRAELRRRDFSQTLLLLDRLGAHGEDLGVVEYYRGEVNRIRRGDGDAARAAEHYTAAITHADAPCRGRRIGVRNRRRASHNVSRTRADGGRPRARGSARRAIVARGSAMNTTRRAVLAAAAGGVLTAGCAVGGIVEGQLRPKGAAYSVNLQRQWSDVTFMLMPRPPGVQMLTVDGPSLNRLYLAGLEPGQSLVRPRDRDTPVPTYRADMSDTEMVELVVDCLAQEFQQPQAAALRPQNLGATPGVRFDLTARTSTGLDFSGTALAARRDDKMQLMLYLAPSEHYYASLLPNVEAIFASAA